MTGSPPFELCVIIDDDEDVLLAARLLLRDLFAEVLIATRPESAFERTSDRVPDVILLDGNFSRGATDGHEGFAWLQRFLDRDPDAVIVMITAHGGVQIAVEAMKLGATDFVSKPWTNDQLLTTVRTGASLRRSRRDAEGRDDTQERTSSTSAVTGKSQLLGQSPAMARIHSLTARAGPTDANVLILGENGTGKELVARELHRVSRRADKVLVSVDLGAIAENLFDSELFGHVKGAFTDARTDRIGRLQAADGGTLFLDEVGNLPLYLQPKLLTALEQRNVTPVGANAPVPIDVRVVAATNLTPAQLADENRFRQDLLFRLNTVEILLPALRERGEDVPLLLNHFLDVYAKKYDKRRQPVPDDVMAELVRHDWPGNVRALRHAAERATILAGDGPFTIDDFAIRSSPSPLNNAEFQDTQSSVFRPAHAAESEDLNLERAERQMLQRALQKHSYNISSAAHELGLTRASLYRRMEKHGL